MRCNMTVGYIQQGTSNSDIWVQQSTAQGFFYMNTGHPQNTDKNSSKKKKKKLIFYDAKVHHICKSEKDNQIHQVGSLPWKTVVYIPVKVMNHSSFITLAQNK